MHTKCYKVVSCRDDKLYSAMINTVLVNRIQSLYSTCHKVDELLVEYKVGEYVKPRFAGSRLCVFTNLDEAVNFIIIQEISNAKIYTCHIKGINHLDNDISFQNIDDKLVENILSIWNHWLNADASSSSVLYQNALCAKEVKLIEEVDLVNTKFYKIKKGEIYLW